MKRTIFIGFMWGILLESVVTWVISLITNTQTSIYNTVSFYILSFFVLVNIILTFKDHYRK